jgi:HD superfamily phosphohydrolase YqeK
MATELPGWSQANESRRAHMERVATVMEEWAGALGLPDSERERWYSAGLLHDALRDAPPETLRPVVEERFRDLPGSFLHGPAAAARLKADGFEDAEVLDAIRFHTIGSDAFGLLGRALIAADFLEPGRKRDPAWRAELRERLPADPDGVLTEVVRARLAASLEDGETIRHEMIRLWNALIGRDGEAAR